MERPSKLLALLLPIISWGVCHAAAAPLSTFPVFSADTTTTVVLLVRHAEKNPHPPGGDAGLSEQGLARALDLARALREAGVSAVFVSPFGRARETAAPLARALGDSVRTYDAHDLESLAARIQRQHRGRTVLVVGHSDTLSPTLDALSGRGLPEGEAVDYDKLYVLILNPDTSSRLLRLRYGAPAE